MRRWGLPVVYLVLLPVIVLAAMVLGYYTWRTTRQFAQLNQQTIAQSTLLAVRQKVDLIENQLIEADNTVFSLLDPSDPVAIEDVWVRQAAARTPSVRAVVVLDAQMRRVALRVRGSDDDKWKFWRTFKQKILPKLALTKTELGQLKHLHETVDGSSYLLSYKSVEENDQRYYVIVHHDVGYIVRTTFRGELTSDEGNRLYNVVDENDGKRVFGPSLANSGVFVVGRRFPTTLYRWRLQAAPEQAPLLEEKSRTRKLNEAGLVGVAFMVLIFGVLVILFAADRERRFNALKSEFIANVSHELKTPLSVVRMFSEMLVTGRVRDDAKKHQYLEIILRESERLSRLIENVLDFAALERGKQEYKLKDGDLTDVITRAVDTFRYRAEQDALAITVTGVTGPLPAKFDDQAVMLALLNLLDNAAKYGNNTAIGLDVRALPGRIELAVRDHGPGIPKEDLKKIFDRFYRSRGKESARGSGIGLALVKHIAEAHGGRAWARNTDDGGAVVAFSISLAKVST